MFKTSHRPDGIFTCFARMLAGRRCVHQQWHGELLIVHHHRQHSCLCACSRSKFPIAPMGFSHVLRVCLQGGGVSISRGMVSFSSCTITGNTADYGGGAYVSGGTVTFSSCSITGNTASYYGGGVYVSGGTVTFSSCTITGNTVTYVRARAQNFPSPRWEFALLTFHFDSHLV